MMSTRRVRMAALALGLAVLTGVCHAQQTPAIEPKAIDALKAMGAELRKLKTFALRSETSKDEVLDNGQKVQFGGTVEYRVRMPNGLRAEINSDRKKRQYFYNGTTVTQYGPINGYYATVAAPPTIPELLQVLDEKYGLEWPLADLFFWGTDKDGLNDIKSAILLGTSRIGGVDCNHYAFRQQDVDWQIWIESGKTPLPRKLVITTTDEPAQPQFIAVLKWDLAPKLDDKIFTFVPPKGALKIDIATTDAPAAVKK